MAWRTATARDNRRPPRNDRPLARDDGRGARQCGDVVGWLDDPTPGGREVHAEPSASSRVLGRIAARLPEDKGGWRPGFDIEGTQDGWLRIEGAGDDAQLTEGIDRPMYAGSGWIRGTGVLVGIQATQAFAQPRHSSDIVLTVCRGFGGTNAAVLIRALP